MVSVIVPAYNLEMYIGKCIDSVLSQDYEEIELIIIDDGSSDGTEEICKKYAKMDSRVVYVKKTNEGQGIARTMGFKLAKGEYVTFVDGDDWIEENAIKNLVCAAENENADIAVGDIWYVYSEGEKLRKEYSKIRYEDGEIISFDEKPEKINRMRAFTWGKLYKKDFLQRVSFEQGKRIYEDVEIIPFLMAKASKIVYVNKPVYNYLKNRSNSSIHDASKIGDMLVALESLCLKMKRLENYHIYENELARFMWSQIRFICLNNKQVLRQKGELYEKLMDLLNKEFPKLAPPDQCEIELINGANIRLILEKILIFADKVKETKDIKDSTSRICVKYKGIEKNYQIDFKQDYQDEESWTWDQADELFEMVWVNYREKGW